jgi:hypothetical protein
MIECEKILNIIKTGSAISQCDIIDERLIRLQTFFTYPEGSYIDIFLGHGHDDLPFGDYYLTDYGQTVSYLSDLHIYVYKNNKIKTIFDQICDSLNIKELNGELFAPLGKNFENNISVSVFNLCQACIRIADFYYTKRFRRPSHYKEKIEDFFESYDFQYTPEIILQSKFDKPITVDFMVYGQSTHNLIITLSTQNRASVRPITNEVFRKWYDLQNHTDMYNFMTLYDSSNDFVKDEDIMRLSDLSSVYAFPAQETVIRELLTI